ncbi:oxygenase MpaB family protein [Corynebacterium rhinophilum]|uniref:oxygenase MpaB family protein n=1 Tax=Corynebacterium rhinophilum TaxID=3050197 RepID=UPI00254D0D2F|nr:oxygenase MpaB family protein [Corynebacterium sp. MSK107]MDK8702113.1 oxygenase MpaB family protein [Corynebacterium sp. MSK107]
MTAPTDTSDVANTSQAEPKVLPMSDNPYEDFRYFYRDGMDLRPAPKRRTATPGWSELRHNVFDSWHTVEDEWAGYDSLQTKLLDDHMWQTDETGEKLAEAFRRAGAKESRAKFEQALNHGIETVEDPAPELVDFFKEVDRIPEWLDLEAAERGRVAYYNVTRTSEVLAIAFAYWATTMEDRTSAATGETGMFEFKAMQRSIETAQFFTDLGKKDVFDRFGEGRKAAVRVRLLHSQANRGLEKMWGKEHYNEFGRPIGSSFLVSGEGWFGMMPLAIDERFGRPHSGQDWDDVAQYWGYILYMMGAEERLIPKTGDEMRKMTDFIYANGGYSSTYHERVATALMSILETIHPLVPKMALGALTTICGVEDTKFMVKGTRWEKVNYKPWAILYRGAARAEAKVARLRDKLPGAQKAKIKRANKNKPPWSDVTAVIKAYIAKNEPETKSDYTLHDDSKEARS